MGNCVGTHSPRGVRGGDWIAAAIASSAAAAGAKSPAPGGGGVAGVAVAAAGPQEDALRRVQMRKRIAVVAEALTSAADIQVPDVPKTEHAAQLIERAIEGNLLFESLSLPAKQAIIRSMAPQLAAQGEVIIAQGDTVATRFYVLERGTAQVYQRREEWGEEERRVHEYAPGSCFGELALLYSAPRAATVRAATPCKLWVMERSVYVAIKRTHQQRVARERRAVVDLVPMLAVLAPEHKAVVAEALELAEFGAGEAVFRQGEPGDRFYCIKEGTAVVSSQGCELARLGEGAFFGERALIREEPRAATVTADTYLVCYALGRAAFNEVLGPIEDVWRYEVLRKVPVLANLSEQQLFQLARCMESREVAAGARVFSMGDPGDAFYVVEEGTFSITDGEGRELARCGKGQCFGELALLNNEPRAATVTAATAARVLVCTREGFDHHLGSLAEIRNVWRFEALRRVPLLAPLTAAQRLRLCSAFTPLAAPAGQTLVTAGEEGHTFYVVERGECAVLGACSKEMGRLGPTAYFGERALLHSEPRTATVVAATDVRLLVLDREAFTRLLGPLQQLLEGSAAAYDTTLGVRRIDKPLKLEDLHPIAVLGSGAFGRVALVRHEGRYYALKTLSKAHVLATGLQEHIKRERTLMAELDSPFVCGLVAAFKDTECLHMLLELVQGGEFFTYLQSREEPVPEGEARFYAGCVALGLEHMHSRGVAWRDLKPENLLIDTRGYLKITDFGFAKRVPQGSKSFTLCGTPEYLAPELVTQAGHGLAVDWWAVGVLVYEMVAGYPPFYSEDRVAMFRAICTAEYHWPSHFSKELRDLIRRLLVRVPAKRLGCGPGGAVELKAHPWFRGLDWDALAARRLRAPYVPQVSGPEDVSNFDAPASNPVKLGSRYVSTGVFRDF